MNDRNTQTQGGQVYNKQSCTVGYLWQGMKIRCSVCVCVCVCVCQNLNESLKVVLELFLDHTHIRHTFKHKQALFLIDSVTQTKLMDTSDVPDRSLSTCNLSNCAGLARARPPP